MASKKSSSKKGSHRPPAKGGYGKDYEATVTMGRPPKPPKPYKPKPKK